MCLFVDKGNNLNLLIDSHPPKRLQPLAQNQHAGNSFPIFPILHIWGRQIDHA